MKYLDIEIDGIDENGHEKKCKLSELKDKNKVIYFYPQDETPICTNEAVAFQEIIDEFPEDTVIIGVSPDNIDSHKKFKEHHKLKFHLLSDAEHKLAEAFENLKNGKEVMRSTFILDKNGEIIKEFREIEDVHKHVKEVLEFTQTLK